MLMFVPSWKFLRSIRTVVSATLLVGLLALLGCSDVSNLDLSALSGLGNEVLGNVTLQPGITPGSPPSAPSSNARAEYDAKCGSCHGADGKGTAFYPQSIAPGTCTKTDCGDMGQLMDYIQRAMPSAGACMGDCALATATIVTEFPGAIPGSGNPASGDAHFRAQCVRCHGTEGEGIPTLGTVEIGPGVCVAVDCADTVALTNYIETSMPPDLPRLCVSDCAVEAALYVSTIEIAPIGALLPASPDAAMDAAPVVVLDAPLTNEDLMAMDAVVVTAVVDADSTSFFSDVGSTSVTTAAAIADAAAAPTGTLMTVNAPFTVKAGQKLNFCNHASSTGRFRAHSSNNAGFQHWGRAQQLEPGQCNMGAGFPEDILPNAIGREAGGMYNHNQGDDTIVFINVVE